MLPVGADIIRPKRRDLLPAYAVRPAAPARADDIRPYDVVARTAQTLANPNFHQNDICQQSVSLFASPPPRPQ